MTDLYLKAVDEVAMNEALLAAGLAFVEGDALFPAEGVNIDVIGIISSITGYDAAGDPVVTSVPGWHVNVRTTSLSEEAVAILAPIEIKPPNTPYRIWA